MAQARIALIEQGLIDKVDATLNGIPDEKEKAKAKAWWEYAQVVERSHPMVGVLVQTLGLSDEQVDDLFLAASK